RRGQEGLRHGGEPRGHGPLGQGGGDRVPVHLPRLRRIVVHDGGDHHRRRRPGRPARRGVDAGRPRRGRSPLSAGGGAGARGDVSLQRAVGLLAAVVLAWGLTWPVNKVILRSLPPLWSVALRTGIAAAILFAITARRGRVALPRREDLPIVLSIALL